MITRSLLILLCLLSGITEVWGQTNAETPVSLKEFTANPWPFETEAEVFQSKYEKLLKTQKYAIKNRFDRTKKDTIIRFSKGKTEIFFYKPYNGKAHLMAANIYDSHIKLKGGISPGITTRDFYRKIAYPDVNRDTVQLSLPDGAFKASVILKNEKIDHIKIEARNKHK